MTVAILVCTSSYAQEQETIQAHAFGTMTMAGRSFNLTISIDKYSTPADQTALIDAFNRGGHEALVKTLSKMESKGRVGITGELGYQIAYVRNIPTAKGRTIRIITDRPINIHEPMNTTRSMDYDLTLLELHLDKDKKKHSGNLVIGGRFRVNKKKKQIEFESYHASPWRLAEIMER